MAGIDRPPDRESEGQKINLAASNEAILPSSVDDSEWLEGYSDEAKEYVRGLRRRRRAALRLAPLPSGKRDLWDPYLSDGPEAA